MKIINAIFIVVSSIAIVSCSSYGKKDFSCNAPVGSKCQSVKEIYEQTNGGQGVFNRDQGSNTKVSSRDGKKGQPKPPKKVKDSVVDTFVAPQLPDSPVPILTPAVVMRVKVYSYEDASTGVLYTPGFIFSEIIPRRWTIGKAEGDVSNGRHLTPLKADPSSDKKQP